MFEDADDQNHHEFVVIKKGTMVPAFEVLRATEEYSITVDHLQHNQSLGILPADVTERKVYAEYVDRRRPYMNNDVDAQVPDHIRTFYKELQLGLRGGDWNLFPIDPCFSVSRDKVLRELMTLGLTEAGWYYIVDNLPTDRIQLLSALLVIMPDKMKEKTSQWKDKIIGRIVELVSRLRFLMHLSQIPSKEREDFLCGILGRPVDDMAESIEAYLPVLSPDIDDSDSTKTHHALTTDLSQNQKPGAPKTMETSVDRRIVGTRTPIPPVNIALQEALSLELLDFDQISISYGAGIVRHPDTVPAGNLKSTLQKSSSAKNANNTTDIERKTMPSANAVSAKPSNISILPKEIVWKSMSLGSSSAGASVAGVDLELSVPKASSSAAETAGWLSLEMPEPYLGDTFLEEMDSSPSEHVCTEEASLLVLVPESKKKNVQKRVKKVELPPEAEPTRRSSRAKVVPKK